MNNLKVLLLAGGKSTRFWPLTDKMKINIMGKTFLEHQLNFLKSLEVNDIIVVCSREIIDNLAGENIKTVIQHGEGQGSAILSALTDLKKGPLLILNADDVISSTLLEKMLNNVREEHSTNYLVGFKTKNYFPGGYFKLNGKRVVRIIEKPKAGDEPSNFVRLVCDYFADVEKLFNALNKVKTKETDRHYEDAISLMIAQGEVFEMIEYSDVWIPVKYPWHLLDLTNYLLSQIKNSRIAKSAHIHKSASLKGAILLEKNVRVMEYAKLVGPLYIGAGTIIGNHTLVRSSIIGEQSVVGFSSDITRSFIGANSWFHSNYVGDSVVASNVGLGAGAILANLRLDEGEVYSLVKNERVGSNKTKLGAIIGDGARIGVGSQIMPGVKIGKNSVVGASVLLQNDLSDKKRCYIKQSHQIEDYAQTTTTDRERFRGKI